MPLVSTCRKTPSCVLLVLLPSRTATSVIALSPAASARQATTTWYHKSLHLASLFILLLLQIQTVILSLCSASSHARSAPCNPISSRTARARQRQPSHALPATTATNYRPLSSLLPSLWTTVFPSLSQTPPSVPLHTTLPPLAVPPVLHLAAPVPRLLSCASHVPWGRHCSRATSVCRVPRAASPARVPKSACNAQSASSCVTPAWASPCTLVLLARSCMKAAVAAPLLPPPPIQ